MHEADADSAIVVQKGVGDSNEARAYGMVGSTGLDLALKTAFWRLFPHLLPQYNGVDQS